jgi:adenylate kinase family enzyme
VPTLELIKRLDERSCTDSCVAHDNTTAKTVERLSEREEEAMPVINWYNKLHWVAKLDGMGSIEEVLERTSDLLENVLRNAKRRHPLRFGARRCAGWRQPW